MIRIDINIDGLQRKMRGIANGIQNPEPVFMDNLAETAFNAVRKNFDVEGRPPWAKLKPATLKRKAAGKKILENTGHMQNTLGRESSGNTAMVTIGTDYAIWHQDGTSKMAARQIMTLPEDAQNALADAVCDYIEMLANR